MGRMGVVGGGVAARSGTQVPSEFQPQRLADKMRLGLEKNLESCSEKPPTIRMIG